MAGRSYVGLGSVLVDGTNIGNCSGFSVAEKVKEIEVMDYEEGGGALSDAYYRKESTEITVTVMDVTQDTVDLAGGKGGEVSLVLNGFNELNAGHTVVFSAPRCRVSPAKKREYIGDKPVELELTFKVLTPTDGSDPYTETVTVA